MRLACRAPAEDKPICPCPWTSADAADPMWRYNRNISAELYNLDAAPVRAENQIRDTSRYSSQLEQRKLAVPK